MASAVIALMQIIVPARAVIVQAWPQPLQWNIGTVYRYDGWRGRSQSVTVPIDIK